MKEKVTIYTLAKELNMSPSMVSRAFSKNAQIAESKRLIVLEAAKKYGYHPNRFASRLSGKTISIGILIYSKYAPVAADMTKGIEKAALFFNDYKITHTISIIKSENKKPWECRDELMSMSDYDGVIVSGFSTEKCVPMLKEFLSLNPNLVQLQNINPDIDCLFSSKHDEKFASSLAAEFLADCLKHSKRKNILLFTGDMSSNLHKSAAESFKAAAKEFHLNVMEHIDMKDNENTLKESAALAFRKYNDNIDGIYITSAVSEELCKAVKASGKNISLVTFDIYGKTSAYINNGTISASIFQDIEKQAYTAFERLADYIISGKKCNNTIYTNIILLLKSSFNVYTN